MLFLCIRGLVHWISAPFSHERGFEPRRNFGGQTNNKGKCCHPPEIFQILF